MMMQKGLNRVNTLCDERYTLEKVVYFLQTNSKVGGELDDVEW